MTREKLELLTDVREIKPLHSTLFSDASPPPEWLKKSFESDLGMQFAIRSLDFALQ